MEPEGWLLDISSNRALWQWHRPRQYASQANLLANFRKQQVRLADGTGEPKRSLRSKNTLQKSLVVQKYKIWTDQTNKHILQCIISCTFLVAGESRSAWWIGCYPAVPGLITAHMGSQQWRIISNDFGGIWGRTIPETPAIVRWELIARYRESLWIIASFW